MGGNFYGYSAQPRDFSGLRDAVGGAFQAAAYGAGEYKKAQTSKEVDKWAKEAQKAFIDMAMSNGIKEVEAVTAAQGFFGRPPGMSDADYIKHVRDYANKESKNWFDTKVHSANFGNTADMLTRGRTQTRPVADVSDTGIGLSMPPSQRLFGIGGGAPQENTQPSYLATRARERFGIPNFPATDGTGGPAVGNTAEPPSLVLRRPLESLMLPKSFEPPKDEKKPQTVTETVPYTNAEKVHEWVKAFGEGKINKDQLAAAVLGMDWEKKDADDKAKALETVLKAIADKEEKDRKHEWEREKENWRREWEMEKEAGRNERKKKEIAARKNNPTDSKPNWYIAVGRQKELRGIYNGLIKEFLAEDSKLSSYDPQVKKGAEIKIAQYPDKIYAAQKAYNDFLGSMRDDFPKREKNIGEYLPIPKNIENKINKVINANKGPGN